MQSPSYPLLNQPLILGISVTQKCNLRCRYCIANSGEATAAELSGPELRGILEYAAGAGIRDVDFSGGEPFTRPDFNEILEYCGTAGLNVLLATNGTLIDDEKAALLKDLSEKVLLEIRISLDGAKKASHEEFRGKGSYEAVCKGIDRIIAVGVIPHITMVVHKGNLDEIDDMLLFMKKKYLRNLHLMPLIPKGRASRFPDIAPDQQLLKHLLKSKKNITASSGIAVEMESPLDCLVDPPQDLSKPKRCAIGYVFLGILPDGSIFPCPHMRECIIGNIRTQSIEQIWNTSHVLQELRNSDLLKGACADCQYKYVCNGGCRGAAYDVFGDYLMPDPFCWIAYPGLISQ